MTRMHSVRTRPRRSEASAAVPIPYRSPLTAFAPFRDAAMSLLLHGCGAHPDARWSYLLVEPEEVLRIDDPIRAQGDAVARWLSAGAARGPRHAPFEGGVAGFFSYEYGRFLDRAMAHVAPRALPYVALGRYPTIVAFDNVAREAFVLGDASAARDLAARLGVTPHGSGAAEGVLDAIDTLADYEAAVARLVERIRAGDLFQANISRLLQGRLGAGDHPFALFSRVCAKSPAPFCCYLRLPGAAIVSNSPERLVSMRRTAQGLMVASSPIKGTRPRGRTQEEDAALVAELLASEKDRAENLMIVDLMRNDISRVCRPGSVRAPKLFALESFANVHHMVSTVEGRMQPGLAAFDLMRAVFPAGSITGAPKIKAMELIHAAEQAPREANYGSMAWFGADGAMDANVLIRTATCLADADGWSVGFRVGGGITIESDPVEEGLETEAKAASLRAAIAGARA